MDLTQLRAKLSGRYDVERELGRGGMGAVYLARDVKLNRMAALKVLPSELADNASLRDRFLRETRTAASFSHPNIVPVYSIEEGDGLLGYAMAFVEGESLADRIKRAGPLTIRETVKLLQDTGYALAYAHGRGVVHRDIKPDNIMLERATGRAMVMDFGIARTITSATPSATQGLTRVGEVIGTPEYMSPEQATGDSIDGRSDLYALGLTAWFALTGKPAMSGATTGKVLARQITELLPPIASIRADVPAALGDAIDRCVMKDPAERFQTGEELVDTIDAAKLSGPDIPLSIRMLQQELGTLSLVLIFCLLIAFLLTGTEEGFDSDGGLIIIIMISVVLTRFSQTMREIGRVAATGFTASDIETGLRAVMAERDQRRAELLLDAAVHRARRRTLIMAVGMLAIAVTLFRAALQLRLEMPGTNGHFMVGPGPMFILMSLIFFGVSVPLLLRSPFRRPIGERAYRLFWLGPVGRGFIRLSGRNSWRADAVTARRTGGVSGSYAVRPPTPRPTGIVAPDRIASLEQRVQDLERWRKEAR